MNKLDQYQNIQELVQKEIQTMFPQLYQQYATQFGVNNTPTHSHNNVDTISIDPSSVKGFEPLSNKAGPTTPKSGVVFAALSDGQYINTKTGISSVIKQPAYTYPITAIYGGAMKGFNGGNAPIGTLLVANYGAAVTLWVKVFADGDPAPLWYGIPLTTSV